MGLRQPLLTRYSTEIFVSYQNFEQVFSSIFASIFLCCHNVFFNKEKSYQSFSRFGLHCNLFIIDPKSFSDTIYEFDGRWQFIGHRKTTDNIVSKWKTASSRLRLSQFENIIFFNSRVQQKKTLMQDISKHCYKPGMQNIRPVGHKRPSGAFRGLCENM